MQLACIFFLFTLIYSSLVADVCGMITVQVPGSPTVGVNTPVAWNRSNGDPMQFVLQIILQGGSNPNNTGQVKVDSGGKPQGSVDVKFHVPGKHVLEVLSSDDPGQGDGDGNDNKGGKKQQVLSKSKQFTVTLPGNGGDNSSSGSSGQHNGTSTSSIPTSAISTTTVSVTTVSTSTTTGTPSVSGNLESSASRTPIIIGSVIGATVGLLVVIFLVFLILRRRERRSPTFAQARMVRSLDPSAFEGGKFQITPYNYTSQEPFDEKARAPSFERQESFHFPDPDDHAPTLHFVPLTDRQRELEERILEWQSQLIGADDPRTTRSVKARIESLKQLQGSPWAREMTDEVPPELL